MRGRTVKYTAGEIGRVRVVEDFLPSAEALVVGPTGLMLRSAPEERVSKHGPPRPSRRRAFRAAPQDEADSDYVSNHTM
jgi:hypothetical protein